MNKDNATSSHEAEIQILPKDRTQTSMSDDEQTDSHDGDYAPDTDTESAGSSSSSDSETTEDVDDNDGDDDSDGSPSRRLQAELERDLDQLSIEQQEHDALVRARSQDPLQIVVPSVAGSYFFVKIAACVLPLVIACFFLGAWLVPPCDACSCPPPSEHQYTYPGSIM